METCYTGACGRNEELGLFEKVAHEKFLKSGKVGKISEKLEAAKEVALRFNLVANRIDNYSQGLFSDVDVINHLANEKEIVEMEKCVEELEVKLEVFDNKKLIEITKNLSKIFGFTEEVKGVSKKKMAESLGL